MTIRSFIIMITGRGSVTLLVASFFVAIALAGGPIRQEDLRKERERANSDDAQTLEEVFFHGNARALVINNVEPNKLRVGGGRLRVKRNPVGEGCFVYDPKTRFYGVERFLVWWVLNEGKIFASKAYPLNGPSKMVTPGLKWAREDGITAPRTYEVIDYVFRGKPMPAPRVPASRSTLAPYNVREYRIYHVIISTPMSVPEEQALKSTAKRYGVTVSEAREVADKVNDILIRNRWFGTPDSEIRHASDWKGEKP